MRFFITLSVLSLFFSTLLFAEAPKITSSMTMLDLNKLTAYDATAEDRFGISVAISDDTAIVGVHGDDCASADYCGSARIFERNNITGLFEESATLVASDGMEEDQFGHSVAISGDTVIVGAFYDDSATGSAYIFEKPLAGWSGNLTQKAKLTASDRATGDEFGGSVSISGDTVIVGAHHDDDAGNTSGSAYLFEKPASGGWVNTASEDAKLTASDGTAGDEFGASVAISGDTVIVGAEYDDNNSGSAYLFEKPASGWVTTASQDSKLTAWGGVLYTRFGKSVAISGDTVIVGAHFDNNTYDNSGSVYLFEKSASGWSTAIEKAKLTASDGAASDYFGNSVAISGDMVIVGAYNKSDVAGTGSGSAYFFQKPVSGWADATQSGKLIASDGASHNWFGVSVAVSGNTAIAGAYGNNSYSGAAYTFEAVLAQNFIENNTDILDIEASDAEDDVITFAIVEGADAARFNIDAVSGLLSFKTAPDFENPVDADGDNVYEAILELSDNFESDTFKLYIRVSDLEYEGEAPKALSFEELNKLTASDAATLDEFGISVAINGTTVVVGASGHGVGIAYIYEYQSASNTFVQQARLSPSIYTAPFGASVAISGDTVVVGAYLGTYDSIGSGLAYVFEKPLGGWSDMTENAILTSSDRAWYDRFGYSVAISGDTVIVGAYLADSVPVNSGAVYLFEKPASGGWVTTTESAKLLPSDLASGDSYGASVAISGDTVVVWSGSGSSGSVYFFEKPVFGWVNAIESAKRTAYANIFGSSVAISGDIAVVGRANGGFAILFKKPASGGWAANEGDVLQASDEVIGDGFGTSIAISGDTVIVGSKYDAPGGSVYLFEEPASGWGTGIIVNESTKLNASDGATGDEFGTSVAISGDTAIVGALSDDCVDDSADCGSAYIFKVKASGVNPGIIMYLLN